MTSASQLKDLKPVETYLLLNPIDFEHHECIKLVIMDLVLKQVLNFEKITKQMNQKAKPFHIKLLGRGKNYNSYESNKYESYFMKPFLEQDKKIEIRTYIKKHLEKVFFGKENIAKSISQTENIDKYIKPSVFYYFTQDLKLNKIGTSYSKMIKKQIDKISNELTRLKDTDSFKTNDLLSALGNNFLLIENKKNSAIDLKNMFLELNIYSSLSYIDLNIMDDLSDIHIDFSDFSFNDSGSDFSGFDSLD